MSSSRESFERLRFEIRPERTALLVIDLQNDTCHKDGAYSKYGLDRSHNFEIIPKVKRLLGAVRKRKIPIVYSRHIFRNDLRVGGLFPEFFPIIKETKAFREGTWGSQIIDELRPNPEDFVVTKHRYSVFFQTDFDTILRGIKADTIIVTGIATSHCLETTVRDAMMRDYKVVVVADCCASPDRAMHEASLRVMAYGFADLIESDKLIEVLEKKKIYGSKL